MTNNLRKKSVLALGLLLAALSAPAQSVFNMPTPKTQPSASGADVKVTANQPAPAPTTDGLVSMADQMALQQFAKDNNGKQPAPRNVMRDPRQPDDNTIYRYRGQNNVAGRTEDGQTQICGLVAFNLKDAGGNWSFKCDTIVSNDDFSPYSFQTQSYIYSYRPASNYTSVELTKFDKVTAQQVGEKWTIAINGQSGIPFQGICYDDYNHQVYATSMGNTVNSIQPYYLNIVDTITGKLRRIGELCHFNGNDAQDNMNPRGLFCYEGQLYGIFTGKARTGLWVARVNPLDATHEFVGRLEGSGQAYGAQPAVFDPELGVFLLNYYDFNVGTVYYSIRPADLLNPDNGIVHTTKLMNASTGFNWFYVDPAQLPAKKTLADISDLAISCDEDGQLLTISLTTPATYTDGTKATDALDVKFFIDNVETELFDLPSSVDCGQALQLMADVTPGLHTLRLELRPQTAGVEPTMGTSLMVCGKDIPAAPTNLKVSVSKSNVATITWNAPTGGRYADFGGVYEGGTMTYRVVRQPDGKVISEGGTARRVQDTALPEEMAYYRYTVTAIVNEREGETAMTDQFTAGTYMALPYDNDLESFNQTLGWTVINANNDGTLATWQWNTVSHSFWGKSGSNNSRNDDWLISPPFRLEAGKVYEFKANLSGRSNLDFYLGTAPTVNGMTQLINQLDPDHMMNNEPYSVFVAPEADGTYYFGLHDYVFGQTSWNVDDIHISEVAQTAAPAMPTELAYTAAEKGQLSATLSLKAPALTADGQPLNSISKISVYNNANGQLLGEAVNPTPGQQLSIDVTAKQGFNYLRVVAENAEGQGWPTTLRSFAGVDRPVMADVRMLWSDENEGSVMLTYHVAPKGVNGGYVDTDKVKYTIYQHFDTYPNYRPVATDITDTEIEVEMIDPTRTGQAQYILAVSATTVEGESELKPVGVVLGKPFTLPYTEDFGASGMRHAPYITYNSADGTTGWGIDTGLYNATVTAQNNDGYDLILINNGTRDGKASFATPIIDFTKAENPLFRLWLYDLPGAKKGGYVTIDAITNGADVVACSDTIFMGKGNGWREVALSLKNVAGKRAQLLLTAYMPDPAARIWADNWNIAEANGNDLAITAISKPYSSKNGQQAEVEVSVTNMGAQTADDFSVLFTLNGEVIDEVVPEEALLPGKETTVSFPLNISSTLTELIYSAELLYDDDNADNNLSAEVELTPEQVELPAPTQLTLNEDQLLWTAPEQTEGREVMLDFENLPAFNTDAEIAGWLNIDGNNCPTTYFVMYNGTYWPNVGQPHGFMTWSAAESGNASISMWKEHQGEHCLISFGHYDITRDGYPINDDNDWFISPEVKGGTKFSFWLLSNGAGSTLEVLVSKTDRNTESFTTVMQRLDLVQTQTWQQVSLTLPDDAKYVAIHIPVNLFGIMIDEISYTEAQAPQLLGYNVYNGTNIVTTATETTATAEKNGTYRVTARYDLGESVPSNEVGYTSGIEGVTADEQAQQVYDLQGRRLDNVRKGLNIVRSANGKARKMVVK